MNIETIKVGRLETNCYILDCNGETLVIDPGDDFHILKRTLMEKRIVGILITHRHPDHIGALQSIIDGFKVPVYDISNLSEGKHEIGQFKFEVIYTPGHTSDSVTYLFYEYNFLFSGDFLFKGTVGRMDLETGSQEDMKKSLEKINKYNDRIYVYPGHGDKTTLGEEKRNNQYFNWINN